MVGQICPAPPHYCRAPRDRHLYKDKYPKFAVLSKEKKILMQNPSGGQCKKGLSKPRPRRRDPEAKMQQISFLWNICFHSWSPKYLKFEIFVFTYDHRTGNVTCPFFFDIGRLKSSCPVACSQCSKFVWFKIPLVEMNFFRQFWDQAINKIYAKSLGS